MTLSLTDRLLMARGGVVTVAAVERAWHARNVLVVDRFDRRGTVRVGYASAMTMLEASDGDQRSYLEIAEVIEERSTAAAALDRSRS